MNHQEYRALTHHAEGFAMVEKCPEGLRVVWDNGLHVVLSRHQVVALARLLTEWAEWERWS